LIGTPPLLWGQKATWRLVLAMSGLPPKADVRLAVGYVGKPEWIRALTSGLKTLSKR
jgi:hypothetical protein